MRKLDYMNGVNETSKKYTYQIYIFLYFSRATLKETFTARDDVVLPRTP